MFERRPDSEYRLPLPSNRASVATEFRDPRGATLTERPVGTFASTFGGGGVSDEWTIKSFYCNVYAYACVRAVAIDVASLPFRVGADPDKPHDFDPMAPLAKLLGPPPFGPNRRTSARRMWQWIVGQFLLTGRFALEKEWPKGGRNAGPPVAVWPLISSRLKPINSEGGGDWFSGFLYGDRRNQVEYQRDDLVYEWRPSADDFRRPESVFAAAKLDTEVMILTDRYDAAFLRNDARPAAIVVTEQFAEADERRNWRQQFNANYGGPDNAGRVMFAESEGEGTGAAVQVVPLGISQRDAQMMERYDSKLRSIAVAVGVPLTRLGDASKRTFSNASAEWQNYWISTILPICTELADAINMQLAPHYSADVGWFDLSNVRALAPEPKIRATDIPTLVDDAIITPNEAREELKLGPTADEEGDKLRPRTVTTKEKGTPTVPGLPDTPASPPAPPLPDSTGNNVVPIKAASSSGRSAGPVVSRAPAPAASPSTEDVVILDDERHRISEERARIEEQRRVKIWKATDARVRSLEDQFRSRFDRLLNRQRKAVLDRLSGKRGRQALGRIERREGGDPGNLADDLFEPKFWELETATEFRLLYRSVIVDAGEKLANRMGINFDLEARWVHDLIDGRSNQLAGNVTATTYQAIKDQLREGVKAGESIPDLAARIEGLFDQTYANRATTVARTEVISAYNASTALSAQDMGPDIAAGQQWISTRDDRVREDHLNADGQVVAIGDTFDVGGEQLAYPGDPDVDPSNSVNCRCTTAILSPAEFAALSERSARIDLETAARVLTEVSLGRRTASDVIRSLRTVQA